MNLECLRLSFGVWVGVCVCVFMRLLFIALIGVSLCFEIAFRSILYIIL